MWKVSIPRLAKKDATWPSARVIATDNFRRVSESYYGIVSSRSLLAVAVVLGGLNQPFDLCLGQVLPCLQVLVGRGARASRNCADPFLPNGIILNLPLMCPLILAA